jgi:hypothetical protein
MVRAGDAVRVVLMLILMLIVMVMIMAMVMVMVMVGEVVMVRLREVVRVMVGKVSKVASRGASLIPRRRHSPAGQGCLPELQLAAPSVAAGAAALQREPQQTDHKIILYW